MTGIGASAQTNASPIQKVKEACAQPRGEREKLIEKAQLEQFNVRRVEILGNEHIPASELFPRIRVFNEGDIFLRRNLEIALKRLSRSSKILPVKMDDVRVTLDENGRSVDVLVCVKEWLNSKEERESRITFAEREEYNIHWIYIGGNTYTRFREFRKEMLPEFNEGYVFKRTALEQSIKRISKMNSIYPITMDNVEVILNKEKKFIDVWINVKQRPRN